MIFWFQGGLPFFIVSCCLFAVGLAFSLLRTCLGFSTILKVIANIFVALFIILELGMCAWSAYMAYLFINPFASGGGWLYNCPNNLGYEGYWQNPNCEFLKAWYIAGICFSLLFALQVFCIVSSSIEIMKSHSKEKREPPAAAGAEGEPLLSTGAPRYNPDGAKYA